MIKKNWRAFFMNYQEILSPYHPLIKHLVKLRNNRKYRQEKGTLFIEGKTCIKELDQPIEKLIVTDKKWMKKKAKAYYLISASLYKKISGLKSFEGIAAEIAFPPQGDLSQKKKILALDRINNPGNLGTLIRSALALEFEGIFISHHSVDPFHEKVLRASKGATFKIPLQRGDLNIFIQKTSFHIYIGTLNGIAVNQVTFKTPLMLLLGNEAHGPQEKWKKAGISITIPIKPQMESLNVATAGAILMHQIRSYE